MREIIKRLFNGRYGSYGTDTLTRVLFGIAIALLVLSVLVTPLGFLYYVAFAILAYGYYRLMSKNITKRYRENEVFKKHLKKIRDVLCKK